MTDYEERLIRLYKRKIYSFLQRNMSVDYIIEWLDDIIYNSFDDFSNEYYSELYSLQDMLLSMKRK